MILLSKRNTKIRINRRNINAPKYLRSSTLISVTLIFLLAADLNAQSYVKTVSPVEKRIVLPTAQDALKAVFANGNILLSSIPSCKRQGTTPEDRTILDYLSGVIGFQAEPKSQNSLKYTIKLTRRNGRPVWEAELLFNSRFQSRATEEEAISSNGVRFLMRTQNKKMISGSLTCTGTG